MTTPTPTPEAIATELIDHYRQVRTTDHIPTLIELVGIAVQVVEGKGLNGKQKMELVKGVVPLVISQLPLPNATKEMLETGVFMIEDLAESALITIDAHQQLQGCFSGWIPWCRSSLRLQFPLLR